MTLMLSLLTGAALGAILGYYGTWVPDTFALTAVTWRGVIYEMIPGFIF